MAAIKTMAAIRRIAGELVALFVDDGFLAASAVAWVALATLAVPRIVSGDALRALILFAGLAALLVASTVRRAALTRS